MKYQGIVKDVLRSLPDRKTRWYPTYQQAHRQAEKICQRTYGSRGCIDVQIKEE